MAERLLNVVAAQKSDVLPYHWKHQRTDWRLIQNTFEAKEVVLGKLFNNDYLFRMPTYQRPYSWTPEETEELLNDLVGAMQDDKDGAAEPYFLGSIVLIPSPNSSVHEVIDGQQRLTTLTMLFCALRELTDDAEKRVSLDRRVRETQDVFAGGRDRFRLEIRDRDQDFFRDNVQTPGKISDFITGGQARASDTRTLIHDNTKFLYSKLSDWCQQKRDRLSQFVIGNCYLVVVSAYDRDSAHRIFSVLNARGRDLTPTDILKSDVIGEVPSKDENKYTEIWENLEDELGREDFRELFAHIFVIETGDRFHKELSKAFNDGVLSKYKGVEFMDEILDRYAEAFQVICRSAYESSAHAEDVNRMLDHLSRLDNDDWLPLAMVFYDKYKSDPATLLALLKDLDRLAYAMFVIGKSRDPRITRYSPIIAVAKVYNSETSEIIERLQLSRDEQTQFVSALNGPVYRPRSAARFARPLLLRLDSTLADANARYDHKTITVEHVLPQSPEPGSEWEESFPDEDERLEWTHRLANLVLLSRSKNTRAQNYDFNRKKTEYFQRGCVPGFALTAQVVNEAKWTPKVLERRQRHLIEALKAEWRLENSRQ